MHLKNFQEALSIGLDPTEYVFCVALLSNRELHTILKEEKPELENTLIQKGFINPDGTISELFISRFEFSTEEAWNEFLRSYPKATSNGRRLHGSLKKAKPKYIKLISKNKQLHEKIIKCLIKEVEDRNGRRKLDYMQAVYAYINQESWTAYEDDEDGKEKRRSRIRIL